MGIVQQGMNQQTPAIQSMLRALGGARSTSRKRSSTRKRAAKRSAKKAVVSSAARKAAKFVKGSAAAKRHMAKLRKMRKK